MDFDDGKIPNPELRNFAESSDSDEERSVIVELGTEPLRLAPREVSPRPRVPPPAAARRPDLDDLINVEGNAGSMRQLESELNACGLDRDLVRLDAAQAFVVSVTPCQLRALSRLPLVGIIRPNRTHRVSSAP
jgi:hypothetical protein